MGHDRKPPRLSIILPPITKAKTTLDPEPVKTPEVKSARRDSTANMLNVLTPNANRRSSAPTLEPLDVRQEAQRKSPDFLESPALGSVNPAGRNSLIAPMQITDIALFRNDAAALHGIPPVSLLATQLSTRRHENICSYRSNGPMPKGLYEGAHRNPKAYVFKGKLSTLAMMAGRAMVDEELGRIQRNSAGEYEFRKYKLAEFPRKGTEMDVPKETFKVTLRSLYSDIYFKNPPKYHILPPLSPEEAGHTLRLKQIDHEWPVVAQYEFKIDLQDANKELMAYANSELVSASINDIFRLDKEWEHRVPQQQRELLDYAFPVSVKKPGQTDFKEIQAIEGVVRDTDVDLTTVPPHLDNTLGINDVSRFTKLIDMAYGENLMTKFEMAKLLFEMNKLEWLRYDSLPQPDIEKRPFLPRFSSVGELSRVVPFVGAGTPAEMYQFLEINMLTVALIALKEKNPQFDLNDLMAKDRVAALQQLHAVTVPVDDKLMASFFIQHPAECRNKTEYTCNRGASLVVSSARITAANNDADVVTLLEKWVPHAAVTLNPKWFSDPNPEISSHAKEWARHFALHPDEKDPELVAAVRQFLAKNPAVKTELEQHPAISAKGKQFLMTVPVTDESKPSRGLR